jgi:hypothetical protein
MLFSSFGSGLDLRVEVFILSYSFFDSLRLDLETNNSSLVSFFFSFWTMLWLKVALTPSFT